MRPVLIAGGGLAGHACALRLIEAGFEVELFELRPFFGGRACSYRLPGYGGSEIDNGQHVLLACCTALLDFYRRLGVEHWIRFHDSYYFLEPGGRLSELRPRKWAGPAALMAGFLALPIFDFRDKWAIVRGLAAVRRQAGDHRLDALSMEQWLERHAQPPRAVKRFWRLILLSAANEELDRLSAYHGVRLIWLAFYGAPGAYRLGIPQVPLGSFFAEALWNRYGRLRRHVGQPVDKVLINGGRFHGFEVDGRVVEGSAGVLAVPYHRLAGLVPQLEADFSEWSCSPITNVHLWFDRPVTELPFAALLGRTIQWFFAERGGSYLKVVISASRQWRTWNREQIIQHTLEELKEYLPAVGSTTVAQAHVVKELCATFSPMPNLEARRPGPVTAIPGLFLGGDWTATGWVATMEGAVRSGYQAAEAVIRWLRADRDC